jgi:hypothetical protein
MERGFIFNSTLFMVPKEFKKLSSLIEGILRYVLSGPELTITVLWSIKGVWLIVLTRNRPKLAPTYPPASRDALEETRESLATLP